MRLIGLSRLRRANNPFRSAERSSAPSVYPDNFGAPTICDEQIVSKRSTKHSPLLFGVNTGLHSAQCIVTLFSESEHTSTSYRNPNSDPCKNLGPDLIATETAIQ